MIPRKWNFPISTLISQATVLHDALIDPAYTTSMAGRLDLTASSSTNSRRATAPTPPATILLHHRHHLSPLRRSSGTPRVSTFSVQFISLRD